MHDHHEEHRRRRDDPLLPDQLYPHRCADDVAYFHAQFRRTNPCPTKMSTPSWMASRARALCGRLHGLASNNNGWWGEGRSSSTWMATASGPRSAAPARRITSVAPTVLLCAMKKTNSNTGVLHALPGLSGDPPRWRLSLTDALRHVSLAHHRPDAFSARPHASPCRRSVGVAAIGICPCKMISLP